MVHRALLPSLLSTRLVLVVFALLSWVFFFLANFAQAAVFLQKLHVEVINDSPEHFDGHSIGITATVDALVWGDSMPTSTTIFQSSASSVFSASRRTAASTDSNNINENQHDPSSAGAMLFYEQPGAVTPTIGPMPRYVPTSLEESWSLIRRWTSGDDGDATTGSSSSSSSSAIHVKLSDTLSSNNEANDQQQRDNKGPRIVFRDAGGRSVQTWYNAFESSFLRTDANMSVDPLCTSTPLFKCCPITTNSSSSPSRTNSYVAYFLAFNATPITCVDTSDHRDQTTMLVVDQLAVETNLNFVVDVSSSTTSNTVDTNNGDNIHSHVAASLRALSHDGGGGMSRVQVEPSSHFFLNNSNSGVELNLSVLVDSVSSTAGAELEAMRSLLVFSSQQQQQQQQQQENVLCFHGDATNRGFVAHTSIFGQTRNHLGYWADVFAQQDKQCGVPGVEYTSIPPSTTTTSVDDESSIGRDPFDQLAQVKQQSSLPKLLRGGGCDVSSSSPPSAHLSGTLSALDLSCPSTFVRNVQLQVKTKIVRSSSSSSSNTDSGGDGDGGNRNVTRHGSSSVLRRLFPLSIVVDSFWFQKPKTKRATTTTTTTTTTTSQQDGERVVVESFVDQLAFCVDIANRGDVPSPPGTIILSLKDFVLLENDASSASSSRHYASTEMKVLNTSVEPTNRPGIALFELQRYCTVATVEFLRRTAENSDPCYYDGRGRTRSDGTATLEVIDIVARIRSEVTLKWHVTHRRIPGINSTSATANTSSSMTLNTTSSCGCHQHLGSVMRRRVSACRGGGEGVAVPRSLEDLDRALGVSILLNQLFPPPPPPPSHPTSSSSSNASSSSVAVSSNTAVVLHGNYYDYCPVLMILLNPSSSPTAVLLTTTTTVDQRDEEQGGATTTTDDDDVTNSGDSNVTSVEEFFGSQQRQQQGIGGNNLWSAGLSSNRKALFDTSVAFIVLSCVVFLIALFSLSLWCLESVQQYFGLTPEQPLQEQEVGGADKKDGTVPDSNNDEEQQQQQQSPRVDDDCSVVVTSFFEKHIRPCWQASCALLSSCWGFICEKTGEVNEWWKRTGRSGDEKNKNENTGIRHTSPFHHRAHSSQHQKAHQHITTSSSSLSSSSSTSHVLKKTTRKKENRSCSRPSPNYNSSVVGATAEDLCSVPRGIRSSRSMPRSSSPPTAAAVSYGCDVQTSLASSVTASRNRSRPHREQSTTSNHHHHRRSATPQQQQEQPSLSAVGITSQSLRDHQHHAQQQQQQQQQPRCRSTCSTASSAVPSVAASSILRSSYCGYPADQRRDGLLLAPVVLQAQQQQHIHPQHSTASRRQQQQPHKEKSHNNSTINANLRASSSSKSGVRLKSSAAWSDHSPEISEANDRHQRRRSSGSDGSSHGVVSLHNSTDPFQTSSLSSSSMCTSSLFSSSLRVDQNHIGPSRSISSTPLSSAKHVSRRQPSYHQAYYYHDGGDDDDDDDEDDETSVG